MPPHRPPTSAPHLSFLHRLSFTDLFGSLKPKLSDVVFVSRELTGAAVVNSPSERFAIQLQYRNIPTCLVYARSVFGTLPSSSSRQKMPPKRRLLHAPTRLTSLIDPLARSTLATRGAPPIALSLSLLGLDRKRSLSARAGVSYRSLVCFSGGFDVARHNLSTFKK